MPDLTFYIDLDPKVGISRISNREKYDRLDQETFDFHEKVRQGYLEIASMYSTRIVTIDGNQTIEEITNQIVKKIEEKI
jgi:dTMP kinase